MTTTATDRRQDENDIDEPRFLGFCIGIPGQPHGRRLYDSDLDAIVLERGQGVICEACEDKLLGAKSWSSANPTEKKNSGKGEGIVINPSKHHPRMPGQETRGRKKDSARPPSKVNGALRWRNYPK